MLLADGWSELWRCRHWTNINRRIGPTADRICFWLLKQIQNDICECFFFGFDQFFCGLKHWKNLFWVLQVSAGRVCQVILCVCLCVWFRVCVVESLLCSEECQCASARVRPRHTVLASAKGQLISNTYFFLSSSFVSHNLFRFWKKETFVIVWFLLEEKIYFFFRSVLVNWFLVSVVCNHNRIGFFLKMKLFFFFLILFTISFFLISTTNVLVDCSMSAGPLFFLFLAGCVLCFPPAGPLSG